ncbi:MAG: hypothetical protein KAT48_13125 [Bacteroidales bacterium]|nr:hypothetical protein [Bacteroidales bacterium]
MDNSTIISTFFAAIIFDFSSKIIGRNYICILKWHNLTWNEWHKLLRYGWHSYSGVGGTSWSGLFRRGATSSEFIMSCPEIITKLKPKYCPVYRGPNQWQTRKKPGFKTPTKVHLSNFESNVAHAG